MKTSTQFLLLLGLVGLGKSQSGCTNDVAIPLDQTSGGGGGGGGGGGEDSPLAASIELESSHGSNDILESAGDSFSEAAARRLRIREDSLICNSDETCYSYLSLPICGNDQNGAWRDGTGFSGNFLTGDYALPDGRKGNFNTGPYPGITDTASVAASTDASTLRTTDIPVIASSRPVTRSADNTPTIQPTSTRSLASKSNPAGSASSAVVTRGPSSSRVPTTSSAPIATFTGGASHPRSLGSNLAMVIAIGAGILL